MKPLAGEWVEKASISADPVITIDAIPRPDFH